MKKLSHKIAIVLALSSFIPLFAYGAYAVRKSYKNSFALVKSRNRVLTNEISSNIEEYLDTILGEVK